jgi:hypothetical protein
MLYIYSIHLSIKLYQIQITFYHLKYKTGQQNHILMIYFIAAIQLILNYSPYICI